jgi:uncharacterized protein DUF6232
MRTFYQGPDAVVTETHFVWHQPAAKIFNIEDLENIRLVDASSGPLSIAQFAAGVGLLTTGVAAWIALGPMAGAPVIVVAVVLAIAGRRLRGRPAWQIRATYRSREVTVYSATDPRIFNQVTRALRRTIERRGTRQAHDARAH